MNKDDFMKKIDDYLSQQKIEDNEQSFRELIKKDIDAWVDFETKRAVSIRLHNDEKQALANRFREKYTPSKTENSIIPMFSDKADDTLISMMKAAFIDSNSPNGLTNLKKALANKDMDWEMILEFLKGDSDDQE